MDVWAWDRLGATWATTARVTVTYRCITYARPEVRP